MLIARFILLALMFVFLGIIVFCTLESKLTSQLSEKRDWVSRKYTLFGLPSTFTIYSYDKEKLYKDTGVFNNNTESLDLCKINKIYYTTNFLQRIVGLGTLHIESDEKTFNIVNIRYPDKVIIDLEERF